jgi:hypothetical protein
MAALEEINSRWEAKGLPHALVGDDNVFRSWCPICKTSTNKPKETLHGAMNDAIAHKNKCGAVES